MLSITFLIKKLLQITFYHIYSRVNSQIPLVLKISEKKILVIVKTSHWGYYIR